MSKIRNDCLTLCLPRNALSCTNLAAVIAKVLMTRQIDVSV